jgi:EamA domain-containing membrane protein RarD
MGTIEVAFLAIVVLSCFWTLVDVRVGLYLAILLDVLRDPVRKLSESQSIAITLIGASIWGAVFLSVYLSRHQQISSALTKHPALRKALILLIAALIPGALLGAISIPRGAIVALIGGLSYIGPAAGLTIGLAVLSDKKTVLQVLGFFCIVNSIALIGSIAEWRGMESRVLGGLHDADWIRYHDDYVVELITGIYRSPDIMGLHAALVVIFALTLVQLAPKNQRLFWGVIVVWAGISLLLCGRRKMIGIPVAFIAAQLLMSVAWGNVRNSSVRVLFGTGLVALLGVLLTLKEIEISDEYSVYATTLVTEGANRTSELVGNSVTDTIRQNGFFGAGLGIATQGRYYVTGPAGVRAWQEDGVSRLFVELGLPGVVLLFFAIVAFLDAIRRAIRNSSLAANDREFQIALLSIVAAAAASFVISHQHFSGDPAMGCLVLILCGGVFALSRSGGQMKVNHLRTRALKSNGC